MSLARASQYANLASRMRAVTRTRGTNCQGFPLWTDEEDNICRRLYPDYKALVMELPRRTYRAIQLRCGLLKLTNPARPWTGEELSRLRRMYRSSTKGELKAAFPHRSAFSLTHRANKIRIYRTKRPYQPTGEHILDELRAECFRRNITMPDLDEIANARGYFRRKAWRGQRGTIDMNPIMKAVRELGGKITVEWEER